MSDVSATSPVAIITGAGRGIGRATAIALSALGYRCALISRSVDELGATASMCKTESLILRCDVSHADDVRDAIQRVHERFGRIDALINNAGSAPLVPFAEMTEAIWRDAIETNLTATFRMCRAVWDDMVRQKSGVIVNLSSEASRDPFNGFSAYAAAKAGINLLTKVLAREGVASNIRAHAVAPAGVETAMLRAVAPVDVLPADKVLAPDDVARTITAIVAGDLAHTSGETIYLHRGAL